MWEISLFSPRAGGTTCTYNLTKLLFQSEAQNTALEPGFRFPRWVAFYSYQAAEGDTIKIESHQETHWNWYSSNNQWTVFPAAGNSYRKIMLNYTLGCPIGGCSEWDYTTAIYANIPTGEMDSTLQTATNVYGRQ